MKNQRAQIQLNIFKTILLLKRAIRLVFFTGTGLLLYTVLAGSTGGAKSAVHCIDVVELTQVLKQVKLDFPIDTADLCHPQSPLYVLADTLIFMKNHRFSEEGLPDALTAHRFKDNFWDYFTSGPDKVISLIDLSPKQDQGNIASTLRNLFSGYIFVMPRFFFATTSRATRIASLLHEATHFEIPEHIKCEKASGGDIKNCDESMEQRGSWATTIETYAVLMNAQELPFFERQQIKKDILTASFLIFNKPARMWATYLVDKKDRAYIFDGTHLVPMATVPHSDVFSRLFDLLYFPKDKGDNGAINVNDPQLLGPAVGNIPLSYYNTPKEKRERIVDMALVDRNYVTMYEHNFYVTKSLQLDFTWTAKAFFYSFEVAPRSESLSYYVLDTDNRLHHIYLSDARLQEREVDIATLGPWRGYAELNSFRVAIDTQGRIFKETFPTVAGRPQWVPVKSLEGRRFKTMTRPFLWNYEVFKR